MARKKKKFFACLRNPFVLAQALGILRVFLELVMRP